MQSRSAEGRLLAALARPLPRESQPASILRDLLDDDPPTEDGEQEFVADAHSVIFAVMGGVSCVLAVAIMAAVDARWGHHAARRAGAVLLAPTAFFMSLAGLIQVAKFRKKHDGVQPVLGAGSWAVCTAVVAVVALIFGRG